MDRVRQYHAHFGSHQHRQGMINKSLGGPYSSISPHVSIPVASSRSFRSSSSLRAGAADATAMARRERWVVKVRLQDFTV